MLFSVFSEISRFFFGYPYICAVSYIWLYVGRESNKASQEKNCDSE